MEESGFLFRLTVAWRCDWSQLLMGREKALMMPRMNFLFVRVREVGVKQ